MQKKKQHHKTKAEILLEKELKKVDKVRKEFIDTKFTPLMEKITQNIEEAQFICESLKTAINQAWQNRAGEMLLSELGLLESLSKVRKPELVSKHIRVIELLQDQSIRDSMILLDALFSESNRAVVKSIQEKKLSDFNGKPITK